VPGNRTLAATAWLWGSPGKRGCAVCCPPGQGTGAPRPQPPPPMAAPPSSGRQQRQARWQRGSPWMLAVFFVTDDSIGLL